MTGHDVFSLGDLGEVVVRTAIIYVALLVGLRVAGRRELGQMTIFDLVVILLISNAVQNSMVGTNDSVPGGLVAAFTLLACNYVVNSLRLKSRRVAVMLGEAPVEIVKDGQFLKNNLEREQLAEDEVLMAMREHGVDAIEQVASAYLEPDGSISIVPKEGHVPKRRRNVRFLKHGS